MSELNCKTKKYSDPDRDHIFGHGYAEIIDRYDWTRL